jgi:transketolase
MRQTCLECVYELAGQDERVVFIGSDLGVGTLKHFQRDYPDRFFMEGISEQHIIGMAAGLAMEGRVVYINTIATFLTRRCYEQLVVDLCLHHAKVRLLSSGGGLAYAPLGPTHQAIEDLAILRALPGMTVVAPADATEMKRLMALTLDHPGPMYIRQGKGGDPIVTPSDQAFTLGGVYRLRQGSDVLFITTGTQAKTALDAAELLASRGLEAGVVHVPTLKPLDAEALRAHMEPAAVILTLEEHTILGGLGGAVAEVLAEACFASPKKFKRMGIPDTFADQYGSQATLLAHWDLTPEGAARNALTLAGIQY